MNKANKEYLVKKYHERFGEDASHYLDCGGRFEILGNHTDHNHGLCIVGTCDLCVGAAVSKRPDDIVYIVSEGHNDICIDVKSLTLEKGEYGSSSGIVKGVIDYIRNAGYKFGGFNAYMSSDIATGIGVSSSAAFELLIGQIVNVLFNKGSIDKLVLAKAGQHAENKYFGKKSGLLDQIGVAYGEVNVVDFGNIDKPNVIHVDFPFKDLHFILIDTGGSHSELSDYYSSIPESMFEVAKHFGAKVLREVKQSEFDAEVLEEKEHGHQHFDPVDEHRATHFFLENKRVIDAFKAIKNNDEETFLRMINESQHSSQNNLFNTQVENQYAGSPQEAVDYANAHIENGAVKINGGGFAGSIICFVRDNEVKSFVEKMKKRFGEDKVIELHLRKDGPCVR